MLIENATHNGNIINEMLVEHNPFQPNAQNIDSLLNRIGGFYLDSAGASFGNEQHKTIKQDKIKKIKSGIIGIIM